MQPFRTCRETAAKKKQMLREKDSREDGAAHKPWLDGIPCLLRTLPLGRRQVGSGQRRSTHTHVKIVYPVFFAYCVTPLASRRGGHRLQEVAAGAGDEDEKDAVRPSPDGQGSLRSHGGLDTLLIGRSFLARSADQLTPEQIGSVGGHGARQHRDVAHSDLSRYAVISIMWGIECLAMHTRSLTMPLRAPNSAMLASTTASGAKAHELYAKA